MWWNMSGSLSLSITGFPSQRWIEWKVELKLRADVSKSKTLSETAILPLALLVGSRHLFRLRLNFATSASTAQYSQSQR